MSVKERPVGASDRELVSRAQRGEANAFEELVYRYDRKVLSIALTFTRDPDDAQDIYQEAFLRVYKALPRFEFGSEFSTWLYRIVMNVCLNHKRRTAARSHTPIESVAERDLLDSRADSAPVLSTASPDKLVEDDEIRRRLEEAVETLSPQERLVFTLRHFEGHKLREIAAMMDCGEGTVKRYLFSAVAKIRRKLKRAYG